MNRTPCIDKYLNTSLFSAQQMYYQTMQCTYSHTRILIVFIEFNPNIRSIELFIISEYNENIRFVLEI